MLRVLALGVRDQPNKDSAARRSLCLSLIVVPCSRAPNLFAFFANRRHCRCVILSENAPLRAFESKDLGFASFGALLRPNLYRTTARFGLPPKRPFALAAFFFAKLLALPPAAPSRAAIQLLDPSAPSSSPGT